MTDFDERLTTSLREEDERYIAAHLSEGAYYKEVLSSLKGPDAGMARLALAGVFILSALLITCLVLAFQADNTREQILFASLAVMMNSAQIAVKIWANMRLNRRAILLEIRKLRLELSG